MSPLRFAVNIYFLDSVNYITSKINLNSHRLLLKIFSGTCKLARRIVSLSSLISLSLPYSVQKSITSRADSIYFQSYLLRSLYMRVKERQLGFVFSWGTICTKSELAPFFTFFYIVILVTMLEVGQVSCILNCIIIFLKLI